MINGLATTPGSFGRLSFETPEDITRPLSHPRDISQTTGIQGTPDDSVQPADDTVEVTPIAKSLADLQAIIDRLNNFKDGDDIKHALKDLKQFINDNTGASFTGSLLGKLGKIADKILEEVDRNPDTFGDVTNINFSADFSASEVRSEDFYDKDTSFSFSFSFVSKTTQFSADFSYSESTAQTNKGASYLSSETAAISLTATSNGVTELDKNPAVKGFADLLAQISGMDAKALLGLKDPLPPIQQAAQNNQQAGSDVVASLGDTLDELFGSIDLNDKIVSLLQSLIDYLKGGAAQEEELNASIIAAA